VTADLFAPPADVLDAPPGQLRVTVWFLEMDVSHRRRSGAGAWEVDGVSVVRVPTPPVHFYRYLFDTVGAPWLWYGRRKLDDAQLRAHLDDPGTELHVPYIDGVPAGIVELDRRKAPVWDLAYFGLIPEAIGRGLGPRLLTFAAGRALAEGASTLTVNTCSLDHPKALATYRKAGFRVVRRVERVEPDPRAIGYLPMTAGPHIPFRSGPSRPG